jgi:transcriptional regulator CtsR
MANISDIIEQFIIKTLGDDDSVDISRNELASFFSCAPSQINYVLETRFTVDRGFVKESRRGGGGFIKISKIKVEDDSYMNNLILESVGSELSYKRLLQILNKLQDEEIITKREAEVICSALSEDSLSMPFTIKDNIRAKAFKNILTTLILFREG